MIENQLADAARAFAALKQMSPTARNMALASIFDERAALAGEVERVVAEIAELRATIAARDEALMRAGRDNLRLGQIIEKVRGLHVPARMYTDNHSTEWHWECAECEGDTFPCDTTKAIDGEQA